MLEPWIKLILLRCGLVYINEDGRLALMEPASFEEGELVRLTDICLASMN